MPQKPIWRTVGSANALHDRACPEVVRQKVALHADVLLVRQRPRSGGYQSLTI